MPQPHFSILRRKTHIPSSYANSTVHANCTRNTSRHVITLFEPHTHSQPPTQYDPANSPAWIKYTELESQLQDFNRTRAIFELGVTQPRLSMPELLWKAYIDFEIEEGERARARALYDRLVGLSGHIKAWISYAQFEAEPIPVPRAVRDEEEEEEGEGAEEKEPRYQSGDPAIARQVFERGHNDLKRQGLKHEVRCSLVDSLRVSSLIAVCAALCTASSVEGVRRKQRYVG